MNCDAMRVLKLWARTSSIKVCGRAAIACDIHRWWNLPQPRPHAPRLQRWFDRILARPATRGVLDLPLA